MSIIEQLIRLSVFPCAVERDIYHRIIAVRGILQMKHILLVFLICIFLATAFVGCDKIQQATDAIDKAKTFSDDLQKKAKEIIPGSNQKEGGSKEGESKNKDKGGEDDDDD
jgi:hypothetical protein